MDWIYPIKPLSIIKLKERASSGEIYRWKDEKGTILLTDDTFRSMNGVPTGQKKRKSRKKLQRKLRDKIFASRAKTRRIKEELSKVMEGL